jgi:hypothetical protein
VKIALEYVGYLREQVAAVGSDEIASLDLAEQNEHYRSSSAIDPITSCGSEPRYRIIEDEIPDWLIAGIRRGQADGRWDDGHSALWWAATIAVFGAGERGWALALRRLINKRGKFAESIREFFATHGYLTENQASYV